MYPGGAREVDRDRLVSASEVVCEEGGGLWAEGLGELEGNRAQWLLAS